MTAATRPACSECGNNVVDADEECDDGQGNNDDECTDLCKLPVCGDGFEQMTTMEECDLGAENTNTGDCTAMCTDAACGDGFVWANQEQCDNGNQNGDNQACKADCTDNICGDGKQGPGEQCDDGNNVNEDACTAVCKQATCGDGFKQPGEECDLGAANANSGACTLACKNPVCGDSFMQLGEECDDGNMSNTDACVGMCKLAKCGDGFLQMAGMEQCDDGNILPNDGCGALCQLEGAIVVKAVAQNKAITDGPYAGTQATMVCVDLVAVGAGNVKSVTLQVGLSHSWIGDLTFKQFSPNNVKTLTLMSRPGYAEALDDGTGCCGDSSKFGKDFPVIYRDAGAKDAELTGNTIVIDQFVCKDDAACDYKPNPGKGPGVSFADFMGQPAVGAWKFCAGDSVAGDAGTIDAVTLTILTQ